jgi:hypothetical protein
MKIYAIAFPTLADSELWNKFTKPANFKAAFDDLSVHAPHYSYQCFAFDESEPLAAIFVKSFYTFSIISREDYNILAEVEEWEKMGSLANIVMGQGIMGSNADWSCATIWPLFDLQGCSEGLFLVEWSDNEEFNLIYRYYDEDEYNNEDTIIKTAKTEAELIKILVHLKGSDFAALQQFLTK